MTEIKNKTEVEKKKLTLKGRRKNDVATRKKKVDC